MPDKEHFIREKIKEGEISMLDIGNIEMSHPTEAAFHRTMEMIGTFENVLIMTLRIPGTFIYLASSCSMKWYVR